MSHRRVGRKLGVVTKHRISMFRNMVTDLLRHESIKTTDTRAKELRRLAEKMITLAKRGTLHSRRQAAGFIRDKAVLKKLFDELAQKYKDRQGGYTRIIKFGFRKGDNAPVSVIELVEEEVKSKGRKKKKSKLKEPLPPTEAAEVKSSKKEAAEELGLMEKKKEPSVEEPKAEAEPVGKGAEKPEEITAEATEAEVGAESPEAQVEETKETPEAKVEESTEELKAKAPESSEASPESTESQTEEAQAPEAKAEGPELKEEGSPEGSSEVEPEEEKKDT